MLKVPREVHLSLYWSSTVRVTWGQTERFHFQTSLVTKVVVNLNRRDLMFSLKDNEITTSNIEIIISSW